MSPRVQPDEAERLRAARLLFERAQAAGISMEEARRREVQERWAEADRRLTARRCGTPAAASEQPRWWHA